MLYRFEEVGEVSCDQIAASLLDAIVGCRAVNVSYDSGIMVALEWEHINGYPITPVLTSDLITNWPISHDSYCDEWYVFDKTIPSTFCVTAFCNFLGGIRIADYKQLD